jgi:DNA-binding transcriptional LysR family regulator
MEMHQVRYFLAAANELNFTKAAEKCNVSQPSLTRAIKQLEGELGGDLFRRERPQAQLTELGERMHPLLKQCYESALGARSLASSFKSGDIGALRLALSHTITLDLLVPALAELKNEFTQLEVKILRGPATEVIEFLKKGEAELAVASELGNEWDRLDRWPLFTEGFHLLMPSAHTLAGRSTVELGDLRQERFLRRAYCESAAPATDLLCGRGLDIDHGHDVSSDRDLITLLEAGFGIALVPRSVAVPATLVATAISGIELRRTVYVYGVAGRQRTAVGGTLLKMLRAADWSPFAS